MSDYIENKPFDEIKIGDTASLKRTLQTKDIELFAAMSGDDLYKQMTYLSKMEAAGIVLGASVPIILTSRGSNELSRKASSAMALIYARHKAIRLSLKS